MTTTQGKAHESATRVARAAASAGANNSPPGPAAPGAEAAQPAAAGGGIIAAIQQRCPDWTLEGPRKLAINGLIVLASLLGSAVVVKATLKQMHVVEAISVPKDLESRRLHLGHSRAAPHRRGERDHPHRGASPAYRRLHLD